MAKNNVVRNTKIYDTLTGTEVIDLAEAPENLKYYAAVVMCGHCGNGYYLPVVLPIISKNVDDAVALAKLTPRVKEFKKNCILCLGEIDFLEYKILRAFNDQDSFLRSSQVGYDDRSVEARRVLLLPTIEAIRENSKLSESKRDHGLELMKIKTADMYPEHFVLQRTFAPRIESFRKVKEPGLGKSRDHIEVKFTAPTKVKLHDFLDDHITSETYKYAIGKRVVSIASMYYQLYGENNPLGIKYKDGHISFVDNHGELRNYEITEAMQNYLEGATIGYKQQPDAVDPYEKIVELAGNEGHAATGLERFNARLAKQQKQPGEE